MENRGHEIKLQSRVVNTRNTIINLIFNGASNKGKLKRSQLAESLQRPRERALQQQRFSAATTYNPPPLLRYVEGGSLTGIYAMRSLGIDPGTGKELMRRTVRPPSSGTLRRMCWSATPNPR